MSYDLEILKQNFNQALEDAHFYQGYVEGIKTAMTMFDEARKNLQSDYQEASERMVLHNKRVKDLGRLLGKIEVQA